MAALALAACAVAQPVTVELKNGDRITGRIISENTNRVVLSNTWSREIAIPLADIAKRILQTNAPLALAKPSITPTNAPKTNGVALAKAIAATNSLFTSPLLKNWHGDLQVGADLSFSERDRQVYNAKAKLTYAKGHLKNVFEYNATYGRSEVDEVVNNRVVRTTKTDADRMDGSIKTEYDVTKKWYAYSLAGMGYDKIRKINLRYEVGPGAGYHLIQASNFFVNVEAGATYQKEDRTESDDVNTFFYRFAENATWKITPRLSWDEKFEYMPRVSDFGEFRLRFESNLRYALLQNIFVNLSVLDIYDSTPANNVTQNDLQFRSSVGVKF